MSTQSGHVPSDDDTPITAAFLRALPKTDVHLHLDGSVRLETLIELAQVAFDFTTVCKGLQVLLHGAKQVTIRWPMVALVNGMGWAIRYHI